MKTSIKILCTVVAVFISVLLPVSLSVFFYINMPGIVLLFLIIWLIYVLIYFWRLPAYQILELNGGNANSSDVFGMKTELLKLVSPEKFILEDSNKAVKAVELRTLLESTDSDDLSGLKKVRTEAELSLGISIDSAKFCRHLLEVFSPSKYKKPEYANEMRLISSDIARCGGDIGAIEDVLINAQKRIVHRNSLIPSYKQEMIKIFSCGVLGAAAVWLLYGIIMNVLYSVS